MLEMIWLGGLTALTDGWLIDSVHINEGLQNPTICQHLLIAYSVATLYIHYSTRTSTGYASHGRSWASFSLGRARARAATSTNGKRNETPWTSYLRVYRWTSRADRARTTSHSLSWFTGARGQTLFITRNVNSPAGWRHGQPVTVCHVIV